MFQRKLTIFAILFLMLALAGCGNLSVSVDQQATQTAAPQATETQSVSEVVPTLQPTLTQEPTETPEPVSTDTQQPAPEGRLAPGTPLTMVQLHMLDAQSGWGVAQVDSDLNDHILFTQDGGQTWQDRTPTDALASAPSNGSQAAGYFPSAQKAWVSYSFVGVAEGSTQAYVWYTSDGGQTWTQSAPLSLEGLPQDFFQPGEISFLNDTFGWMLVHMGAGMSHDYISIFTTHDGGQNWTRVADPMATSNIQACPKTGIAFTTDQNGWLTADCPGLMPPLSLYVTYDGGQSWTQTTFSPPSNSTFPLTEDLGNNCGITDIPFASPRTLMLQLRCSNFDSGSSQSQAWLMVANNNLNWEARSLPFPNGQASFISPDEGFLIASANSDWTATSDVYHTTDGGKNWQHITPVGWNGTPDFVDSQNGWVLARSGETRAFVRSTDGGLYWQELHPVVAP